MTSSPRRPSPLFLLLFLFLLPFALLSGCDSADQIASGLDEPGTTLQFPATAWNGKTIGVPTESSPVYTVTYNGRTYNTQKNQTTFNYELENKSGPSQTHIYLEQPTCTSAPVAVAPSNGTPTTEIGGYTATKWTIKTGSVKRTVPFSVTHAGEVFAGDEVRVAVKGGNVTYVTDSSGNPFLIPGPCRGDFTVTGKVTSDGTRGIANVPIYFVEELSSDTSTAVSGSDGSYEIDLIPGRYDVSVPEDYTIVSPSNLTIAGGADQVLDLQVSVNSAVLIGKIARETDTTSPYYTTGLPPSEWLKIFRQRNGGNAVHSETTLLGFLSDIYNFHLANPYQQALGSDPINGAIAILSARPATVADSLFQELFTLQLNHYSDRGLAGNAELQQNIMAQQEEELAVELGLANKQWSSNSTVATTSLSSSLSLTTTINRSGGGSGGVGKR